MNQILKEIEECLMHFGVGADDDPPGRGSGRYPKGSGENPYQHGNATFLERVDQLKKEGFIFTDPETGRQYSGDTAIAKYFKMSRSDFQALKNRLKTEERNKKVAQAASLREEGKSLMDIARIMGFKNDSSVRALLNEDTNRKRNAISETIDILKSEVDKHKIVDIGVGVEKELGISKERLKEAVSTLKLDGYKEHTYYVPQINNKGKYTTRQVLCTKDVKESYLKDPANFDKVHLIENDYVSHDGGETFDPRWVYPKSMDSKRLKVIYGDEGGSDKDGLIELRRGVDDLSLGNSSYAQVRILVDGTHYIKGMAIYRDDMPKGVDVLFNTNKPSGTPVCGSDKNNSVLKPISKDPSNPFGSLIKDGIVDPRDPDKQKGGQSYYYDKDGKKQLSLINKRAEEGDWGDWADKLPAQFLAKQSKKLIKAQLDITYKDKMAEFEDIMALNNPTIKKALLKSFADDCDTSAVHLKAASLPRQKWQVIIPLKTIKDNEVYAPQYTDGETVALVRYPHGGTFEIPILRVNNKQKEGNKVLGKIPKDAVGINSRVAARLSGADFDGDTVMVIPCNSPSSKIHITATHPLAGLEGFDPKLKYGGKPDSNGKYPYKIMKNTQIEMGMISNLITDMTLKGAPEDDLAKAVRHSMVVIDAEKHKLNYKQSEIDNNILALKRRYQKTIGEDGKVKYGVSTLISRAKSPVRVPKRQGDPIINDDGSLSYKLSDDLYYEKRTKVRKKDEKGKYIKDENGKYVYETYVDPKTGKTRYKYEDTGKIMKRTQESTQMAETNDALTLSSGTVQETLYGNYANQMKALGNMARKEMISTGNLKYNPSAKVAYEPEIAALKSKLNDAEKNAPRERQAQAIANSVMNAKRAANDLTKAEDRKLGQQALNQARQKVGAHRKAIDITDKEWEAIQAGGISENLLNRIIKYADMDVLKEKATPRGRKELSDVKISRIKTLAARGYTIEQIAKAIGVSSSTVSKYL